MKRIATLDSGPVLKLVLFTALTVRIAAAFWFDPPLISDDRDYHAIAQSLVRGEGFAIDGALTAYRLPGYPYVLAAVYGVFGESGLAVRLLQALVDVFSCLLTYLLGRRLLTERQAQTAAGIYAILPISILYTTVRMSESVFTACFLLFLVLLPEDPKDLRRPILLGVIAGCAVLIRSTALLLPVIILVAPSFSSQPLSTRLRSCAMTVGVMFIVLCPWMARNERIFDRFSLTSNGGVNFWMGNHSGASGSYSFPAGNPLDSVSEDFDRSDLGYRLGLEFWRDEPAAAVVLTAKKLAHFFAIDYWMVMVQTVPQDWRPPERAITFFQQLPVSWLVAVQLPFVAIMVFALPGIVFLSPDRRHLWKPVMAAGLLWIAAHLLIYGTARYRFPLYPLFILAAVEGWMIAKRERPVAPSRFQLIVVAILALVLIGGWSAEMWMLLSNHTP